MITSSPIPSLKETIKEEDWSRVVPALRQDHLIWSALKNFEFLTSATKKLGENAKKWTPTNLALLSFGVNIEIDELRETPLKILDNELHRRTTQAYELHSSDTPPELDLQQAGLLALYLFEHPNAPLNTERATTFSCMYGLVTKPIDFLSKLAPDIAVQVLLSQPLPVEEQKQTIENILNKIATDHQVSFLQELSLQRHDIVTSFGHEIYIDFLNKLKKYKEPELEFSLNKISKLVSAAEVQLILELKDEYHKSSTQAWKDVGDLFTNLAVQSLISNLLNFNIDEAFDIWTKNKSKFTVDHITEIIILLEKLEKTGETLDWFDNDFISNTYSDFNNPDQDLACGIIAYHQDNRELSYSKASKALEGYLNTTTFIPGNVQLLSRHFLTLNMPTESIQAISHVLEKQPNNIDAILLKLKSYQFLGEIELIRDTAQLASALVPENFEIRRILANSLEVGNHWDQALEEREAVIRHQEFPALIDFHNLASCALQTDNPQRAAEVCQRLLDENPDDVEAHRLIGEAYLLLGDPLKAQIEFQTATQISPDSVKSWLSLAELYNANDQKETKLETLQAASNANPENPEVNLALGKVYYQEKSFTKALHALQTGDQLVKKPSFPNDNKIQSDISDYLGRTLYHLGHIDDANTVLKSAYEKDPGHVGISHMYGKTLIASGSPEQAVKILSLAQKKSPGDLDLNLDFAKACIITASEPEKAKETLLEISKNHPQRYDAMGLLGEAYELNQEHELALTSYQKALNTQLRDNPEWGTRLSLGLGRVSLKLGQPDIAITTLKNALVSNQDDIDIHRTLSDAYLAADMKEKSLSAAKSALNLDTDDEPNIDWYIQQSITLDATDKAIEALKELLHRDPNRSSILTKLGWLYLYEGDAETALNTFNHAKTIDIISPLDLYKVSQGFLAINEPESAIECLDKAIYMSESTPEIDELESFYTTKATAQQMVGDLEGAIKTIDESLSRIKTKPEIIKKKTKILSDLDRFDEAIACLEDGIKAFPADDDLIIQSIGLYRASGDLRTAAKHAVSLLRLPKDSSMRPLDKSTAAIISDLADALLQSKLAKEIIDNTQSVDIDADQLDLAYYCSLTKLSLDADEDIAAADAITAALKIDPKHPRVLALQARLTLRQGDFYAAEQILSKGLKATDNFPQLIASRISTGDLSNLSLIEQPVSTFLELADVCINFQHWSVAIFLLQKAITLAPNEPRSHFNFARALVLRAEHQRLCQSLGVINNSPGKSTIEEFTYKQFENAILKAAHLITEIITPIDSVKSQNIEPKLKIAKWLARGQAIFQPSNEHAQALANLNKSPDNQSAYIAALRYCDDFTGALKTSQNIYQEFEKQIADPDLLCQIALCLIDESPEIAAEAIDNAIKISNWTNSPNGPIYYAIQAEVARNMGVYKLQLQAIESALAFWSNEPTWLNVAADLHLNQPDLSNQSTAIQYLEHAASLQPKVFNNHLKLAKVFQNSNSLKDVVRVLENATNVIPKQPEPWLALARAYQQNGDIPQSIRSAKMVVQIDPSHTDAYLLLANVALEVDNPEKSFKYIDNVLSEDPENSQALLLRSRTYQALGKTQEALDSLDIAIPNLPKSIPVQLERIGLIREAKGEEKALEALKVLNHENPENPQILAVLSEVLSKTGQQDAAIQTALEALPEARLEMQKSELVKLLQLLGRLLRKSGQLDQAIHNLSEAINLSPQEMGSYLELGRCYQDQRQYDRALQNFNTAINLSPDSPQAYYFAGIIFKESKDYENAERMFKKAAKYAPDDLNIHRQLGAVTAINLVQNCQERSDLSFPTESMES